MYNVQKQDTTRYYVQKQDTKKKIDLKVAFKAPREIGKFYIQFFIPLKIKSDEFNLNIFLYYHQRIKTVKGYSFQTTFQMNRNNKELGFSCMYLTRNQIKFIERPVLFRCVFTLH